ncbi:MAG TPA: hypothetical protein VK881_04595 [bacterium]|nr:hypothetical protein [bacterium]
MTRGHLLVEFVGLPGAGKTTLARAVAGRLARRGLAVKNVGSLYPDTSWRVRARKMARGLRGTLSRPHSAYRSGLAVLASGQRSLVDAAKAMHNWLFVSSVMEDNGPGEHVVLLDEGVFQALWSIGYSGRNGALAALLHDLYPLFPRPDLVVIVDVRPATAAARLAGRPFGGSRLERVAADDPHAFVRAVQIWQELRRFVEGLSTEPQGVDVTTVDNNGDGVEAHADALAARIEHLWARRRPVQARVRGS